MNIEHECIGCIAAQSRRVCDAIHANPELTQRIITAIETQLKDADFSSSPPVVAAPLYELMAHMANKIDLYDEQKALATDQARQYLPFLREQIDKSDDPFMALLKTAVVGNVIDLAAEVSFDLHGAIMGVFDLPFGHDDTQKLKQQVQQSKSILYIGDNAGEHLFDMLAIETMLKLFPHLNITYMVRGNPIINDVTIKEALEAQIDKVCSVVDSGVNTPGFVYERATEEAQRLFDTSDLIIAKGMGNYECMTPQKRNNIAFLLKVKCSVVSRSLEQEIGQIVCRLV